MIRLTLLRHASAQWKNTGGDFDRPLDRRGVAEAEYMARRLAELELRPDLMLTSPARRAQQTAEILVREARIDGRRLRFEERLYLARASDVLRIVHSTGPRIRHLMIVGHNPGISELARRLSAEWFEGELATAALCSLSFEDGEWNAVGAAPARDVLHEAPGRILPLWS